MSRNGARPSDGPIDPTQLLLARDAGWAVEHTLDDPRYLARLLTGNFDLLGDDWLHEWARWAYVSIDARYPDDPGDIWDWNGVQRRLKKAQLRRALAAAFKDLHLIVLDATKRARLALIEKQLAVIETAAYQARRPLVRQQAEDAAADARLAAEMTIEQVQATDPVLQGDLARAEQRQRETVELRRLDQPHEIKKARIEAQHKQRERRYQARERDKDRAHEIDLKKLEAQLEEARGKAKEPLELQKIMWGVFKDFGLFQQRLLDAAIRNPALQDRYATMGHGISQMQLKVRDALQGIMTGTLDEAARQRLVDETIKMYGDEMSKYFDDVRRG